MRRKVLVFKNSDSKLKIAQHSPIKKHDHEIGLLQKRLSLNPGTLFPRLYFSYDLQTFMKQLREWEIIIYISINQDFWFKVSANHADCSQSPVFPY